MPSVNPLSSRGSYGNNFSPPDTLAKGITMNLGKTGISFTAGVRGMGMTTGPGKDTRAHLGLPGTGLSFNHNFSAEERRKERSQAKQERERRREQARKMRENQRRDRERAAREAMQARQNQLQAWKDEVGQYNEYVEGITSFHKIPIHLDKAEKEFAERLQPRTFEKKFFDKTVESLPEFSWSTAEYPAKKGKEKLLALTADEEIEAFYGKRLKRCNKLDKICNIVAPLILFFALGYGISCYIADDGFLWSIGKSFGVFSLFGIPTTMLLHKPDEISFSQKEIDGRKEYINSIEKISRKIGGDIDSLINYFESEKEKRNIRSDIAGNIKAKSGNALADSKAAYNYLQRTKLRLIDALEKKFVEDEQQFHANEALRLELLSKAANRDIDAVAALCEALLPWIWISPRPSGSIRRSSKNTMPVITLFLQPKRVYCSTSLILMSSPNIPLCYRPQEEASHIQS